MYGEIKVLYSAMFDPIFKLLKQHYEIIEELFL